MQTVSSRTEGADEGGVLEQVVGRLHLKIMICRVQIFRNSGSFFTESTCSQNVVVFHCIAEKNDF